MVLGHVIWLEYLGKNLNGHQFFFLFFLVGPPLGPKSSWAKRGPAGRVWAPKKIHLIIGPGQSCHFYILLLAGSTIGLSLKMK